MLKLNIMKIGEQHNSLHKNLCIIIQKNYHCYKIALQLGHKESKMKLYKSFGQEIKREK